MCKHNHPGSSGFGGFLTDFLWTLATIFFFQNSLGLPYLYQSLTTNGLFLIRIQSGDNTIVSYHCDSSHIRVHHLVLLSSIKYIFWKTCELHYSKALIYLFRNYPQLLYTLESPYLFRNYFVSNCVTNISYIMIHVIT